MLRLNFKSRPLDWFYEQERPFPVEIVYISQNDRRNAIFKADDWYMPKWYDCLIDPEDREYYKNDELNSKRDIAKYYIEILNRGSQNDLKEE